MHILPWKGRAIAYKTMLSFIVTLNLFQGPFLVTSGGSWGAMDAEPQASAAKQVQHDVIKIQNPYVTTLRAG
ncbi:hypothetical protein D0Z70_05400 [Sphingobium terrigena]|uniref:Uncharacterized protein n=1 Tax=Sphingobium terrigena TaxID=2304063 RepID=A0A418YWH5_9SPHN|nr:hypothetical protein D0Z70_05400 [Sphingobium terrigena]